MLIRAGRVNEVSFCKLKKACYITYHSRSTISQETAFRVRFFPSRWD